ncbi:MAG: sigma-54 dependent transcriptional regulator [Myxococcota bacterium]
MGYVGKILVLDDEPNILISLSRALELEDYQVVTARNVGEARHQLASASPDVCLFDVKLPDGDGLSLLEAMGADGDRPPVIVMSGHGTIDDAVRALQLGAVDYLEKPIGQERLLLTVAHTLERARLKAENAELKARMPVEDRNILGRSKVIDSLRAQIDRVATSEGRVLITGENGTGKELIAHAIHAASSRSKRPFVSLNCAAVPADLIESELFGHEKGAFTGAVAKKIGKFERADGGTLFLDEVGDMPANMQAKLLRVLQTGELERVGGNQTIQVDVRVLAATNKDLPDEIGAGRFREDLYYRLNVVPLRSPPLRDRREDIPLLVERFAVEAAARNQRRVPKLTPAALALLAGHDYPGNVRELRNLVERIVILAPPGLETLDEGDIRDFVPSRRPSSPVGYEPGKRLSELVAEAERAIVIAALRAHDDVVADTARALGVERSNFHKKLKSLGLK